MESDEVPIHYMAAETNSSRVEHDYYDSYDYYNYSGYAPCISQRSQAIVGLTITSFGIPMNVTFMIVVARVRSMRTVTNAYLVNVAVADVLHLFTHWAAWFCLVVLGSMCPMSTSADAVRLSLSVNRIMQFSSLLTVTVLGFDRYLAVCRPVLYKRGLLHRPAVVVKIISAIWVCSVLMSLETVLQALGLYNQSPWIFLIVLLASVLTTAVFYSLIIRKVRKATRKGSTAQALRSREKQIVRLCIVTTVVYFMCAVPMLIQTLDVLINYYQANRWFRDCAVVVLMNVATFCLEINSSVNPIIYNAASSKYRKAFVSAFCMKCFK